MAMMTLFIDTFDITDRSMLIGTYLALVLADSWYVLLHNTKAPNGYYQDQTINITDSFHKTKTNGYYQDQSINNMDSLHKSN